MRLSLSLLLVSLLFIALPASSQIVIDWTEIVRGNGSNWWLNGAESLAVNVGSTGGPQAWNFTSQPMGLDSTHVEIVPLGSSPFPDSFQGSNLIQDRQELDSTQTYIYQKISPSFLVTMGQAMVDPDTSVCLKFNLEDSMPLPGAYGNTRHFRYEYTMAPFPDYEVVYDIHGLESIDAYGTVTIPMGTFPCLRIASFDTMEFVFYYQGTPVNGDTMTSIVYTFVGENYPWFAYIRSYEGETDPNFTEAHYVARLTQFTLGVEETGFHTHVARPRALSAIPNPFSRTTEVSAGDGGRLPELFVYDLCGRLAQASKQGIVGENLPTGMYFVRAEGFEPVKILKLE